jgi:DMSO/TMAO reductase YedYZ molybdopterin-dependent catalytic subunit
MRTYKQYFESQRICKWKGLLGRLMISVTLTSLLVAAFLGCTVGTPRATAAATTSADTGKPGPIVVPTMPEYVPDYLHVDPDNGLHMTGTPTVVDFAAYRLVVSGKVNKTLSLTYDELRLMPKMTSSPVLVCPGYFVDNATWSGVSLKGILDMAGVQTGATKVSMKSADGYMSSITLAEAMAPENYLAYELAGKTLPVLQGFPLRAVIPAKNGNVWVKWLLEIVVE